MATLLNQPPRPVGPQQQQQPAFGFDLNQLMQMLMAGQMQQQDNLLSALNTAPNKIAQSPNNQRSGLDAWYGMNPHALQGEGYNQSRQAQVQQNQMARQTQSLQGRAGLADLINQLQGQQQQFMSQGGMFNELPVNPFFAR